MGVPHRIADRDAPKEMGSSQPVDMVYGHAHALAALYDDVGSTPTLVVVLH